ncbi:Lrp/AsnC family transcriptional regulator [Marinomonas piezotolerans]|uniref:Lrp/AsnC family transcriptional regulator n=1 Tax=Marinomonas piezotolerans TaxID=2213058 RepID=A0A370U8X4_9GAMM|nr:Lrp/AsnC family transcriptional regulator [Marinomonas piezotolerans]RDL44249.1 Lrp/AsnC family transcriptional regulator [Marinomonas piezotolerans]
MNALELDAYDWRLLQALQSNARLSNVALSEQVNLSPSQCSRRLHRLEQSNLIESYNTQLNISELGYNVTAFITVTLEKGNTRARKNFQDRVAMMDTVLECYSVTGESDYWLKVIAPDLPSLATFLSEDLAFMEGVRDASSTVVLNKVKQSVAVPLPS